MVFQLAVSFPGTASWRFRVAARFMCKGYGGGFGRGQSAGGRRHTGRSPVLPCFDLSVPLEVLSRYGEHVDISCGPCGDITMSYSQFFIASACVLILASCGQPAAVETKSAGVVALPVAPDPKADFAGKLNDLSDAWEQLGKTSQVEPGKMITAHESLTADLESISVKGLPEELEAPFTKLIDANKPIGPLLSSIPSGVPKDPAAAQAYLQENPEAMKTMMDLQEKMILLQTERNVAVEDFGKAAETLGLDVGKFLKAAMFTGTGKPTP